MFLSWVTLIQSKPSHPISLISILILSTHLDLLIPSGLYPPRFLSKARYAILFYPVRATRLANLILLDLILLISFSEEWRLWSSSLCDIVCFHVTSSYGQRFQKPILEHPQSTFFPQYDRPIFRPTSNKQNYNSVHFNNSKREQKISGPNCSRYFLNLMCS